MIGFIIFEAAYQAENVRGGLQVVDRGQYEAAQALGLNGAQTTVLIILPQAYVQSSRRCSIHSSVYSRIRAW